MLIIFGQKIILNHFGLFLEFTKFINLNIVGVK